MDSMVIGDPILGLEEPKSEKPVLFEEKPLPIDAALADIPEVSACVMLMRNAMRSMRKQSELAPFIRKQKLKTLQLDFLKLGGRLKALSKLLKALDEHPDYYEVQEDVKDCTTALALLIQNLAKKHKLDIGAWCREHYPLTPEQEAERDAYEARLLAQTQAASASSDEIDPDFAIPVPECSDAEMLVTVPDCGDTGIFSQVANACGEEHSSEDFSASKPKHDYSKDPIDLDT